MSTPLQFIDLPIEQRLALSLSSPAPLRVTGDDVLQLSVWNSITSVQVVIAGRFLILDGTIVPFLHLLTPATDRSISSLVRTLGEGWLLSFTVFVSAAAPIVGQTFARVQIVRTAGATPQPLATLGAEYITAVQPLAWPGCGVARSIDGPGAIRSITGTNPAANVDISETVPTGARWSLGSLTARLTTDATAANRLPVLRIDDGTLVYFQSDPPAAQAASLSNLWLYGNAVARSDLVNDTKAWGGAARLVLLAGHRIRTATVGLQATDNWDAPQLLVEEWIEGAA